MGSTKYKVQHNLKWITTTGKRTKLLSTDATTPSVSLRSASSSLLSLLQPTCLYLKKNYCSHIMRGRVLPIWMYTGGFVALNTFVMLKPLRPEELDVQFRKRLIMGKWLYTTYHLGEDAKNFGHETYKLF